MAIYFLGWVGIFYYVKNTVRSWELRDAHGLEHHAQACQYVFVCSLGFDYGLEAGFIFALGVNTAKGPVFM